MPRRVGLHVEAVQRGRAGPGLLRLRKLGLAVQHTGANVLELRALLDAERVGELRRRDEERRARREAGDHRLRHEVDEEAEAQGAHDQLEDASDKGQEQGQADTLWARLLLGQRVWGVGVTRVHGPARN